MYTGSDAKRWVEEQGEEVAQIRGVSVSALNRHTSNEYWLTVSSFLTVRLPWNMIMRLLLAHSMHIPHLIYMCNSMQKYACP